MLIICGFVDDARQTIRRTFYHGKHLMDDGCAVWELGAYFLVRFADGMLWNERINASV